MAATVVAALSAAPLAQASPKFWNTGENLNSFDRDAHWVAEKVVGSSIFEGTQQAWVMDKNSYPVMGAYNRHSYTNSSWISFNREAWCSNDDIFRFSTTFTIPNGGGNSSQGGSGAGHGDAPTSYRLFGKYSSDNASELYVNGHLVAQLAYYSPSEGYSFEVPRQWDGTEYLQTGLNTVSILVGSANTMGANVGPVQEWMGLRVEGELRAVPEPATLATLGVAIFGLARRKRSSSQVH